MEASYSTAREEPCSNKCFFTGDDALLKAENYIFQYEQKTLSSFVKIKGTKKIELPVRSELIQKRVYWEERSSNDFPISFDGVPFLVLGCQMRECCHGPDRHRSEKIKSAREKDSKKADHEYTHRQKRHLVQTTKKLNCPARIYIRSIVRFPTYKIDENSEWGRRKHSKQLCADLKSGEEIVWEYRVYVSLPSIDSHRNHLTDQVGSMTHNVDERIIKKIHSLVDDGVKDVGEMKRHIISFSKINFPGVPESSNRFYPSNRCLRNHMYAAMSLSQFSTEDQENLKQHVNNWRNERPDDCFYFVPSPKEENFDSEIEDFLFVHQAAWQRRLLSMYGNEICLLDATYCVCKCDVSLFFVCVSTNVGYITVGCFLLPAETVQNISRGLRILKQWNPDWSPAFFMTDYDQKEIAAIESTFPDCFTFLCSFHREQSWERWLKSAPSGVKKYKNELLQKMRDIAHADSKESYENAVISMKNSNGWKNNEHLRVWFEKQWLSASKRWVYYHRQCLKNIRVTTTNGLERQHYELKQNYLKNYTEGTVTSLVKTVTSQFLPDSFKRYRERNVRCLDTSRMYSDTVPQFLRNRPQLFRDHCTKRLSSAMMISLSDITVLPGQKFKISSADGLTEYTLDLSESLPRCSCPDWKKFHLPCKHMLSILLKVEGCGWDSLSDEFTTSPHLNVDRGVCSNISTSVLESPSTHTSTSMVDSNTSDTQAETTTSTSYREQRQGTVALGSRCKMLASSIHSMLHLIQNASHYELIYKDLMALHSKIRPLVPKEAGLLKRPSRPGRKPYNHGLLKPRRRYRKATGKVVKTVRTVGKPITRKARIVPLDTSFQIEEHILSESVSSVGNPAPVNETATSKKSQNSSQGTVPFESTLQSDNSVTENSESLLENVTSHPRDDMSGVSTSLDQTAETVLQHILSNPATDRPIVQIGPYTITDSSMHYLNSTLSDEVIDSCLHLMATGNVFHVDCANMTAIFESHGSQESTSYLPRLQRYDALMGAVNEGGVHWVLMVIIPGAKTLLYMNPLGEHLAKMREYQHRWCMFLKERSKRDIESTMTPEGWKVETVSHSRQLDSSSCGIYVIRFAENYLSGQFEKVTLTNKDLQQERKRIQLQLLSRGIQEQEKLALIVQQSGEVADESGGQERTRKRRKCERKPSMFVYEKPKKVKTTLKYCVCQQEDDGRKYWKCEECDEWYHPECVGLKEEEEPDIYVCPGCKVKKNELYNKICPTMSDVEEELLDTLRIEEADPFDDSFVGELQGGCSGFTPVFLNNPAIQFFVDTQKQKGQQIEKKETGWGPFVLIPNEKLEEFFVFRTKLNLDELLTVSTALHFYLNNYGKNIRVMYVSEHVVRLHPNAVERYKEWLVQIKDNLS